MATDHEIKIALDRAVKALELRPSTGQSTMKTTARLEDGLKCVSREGDWTFEMDLPKGVGGEHAAPSPGCYGRSALVGCLAMGIKMQAAQAEVPIGAIDVALEADCDDRGDFGLDDVPPGFKEFRLKIKVESPAPAEAVRATVDRALEVSSWLAVFVRAQSVKTDVSITQGAAAAAE